MWIDRDGKGVTIKGMSSPHLLAAIHMIERNRLTAIAEMYMQEIPPTNFEYYVEFPNSYNHLVVEAKRRKLIGR